MNTLNFMKRYYLKLIVKCFETLGFSNYNILVHSFYAILFFPSDVIFISCPKTMLALQRIAFHKTNCVKDRITYSKIK